MQRFLLFAGDDSTHPTGGWNDLQGNFSSLDRALAAYHSRAVYWEWWHIVDQETCEIVRQSV